MYKFLVLHRLRRVVRDADVVPVEPDVQPSRVRGLRGLQPLHRGRQCRHPGIVPIILTKGCNLSTPIIYVRQ